MDASTRNEPERVHVLVSYAYWRDDRSRAVLDSLPPEWNVMLDSGAFTNFTSGQERVTLDGFAAFCHEHEGRFWRIINLDKIGDPEQSERNLRELHRRGVPVIPVFQRGDEVEALERMREMATPVCIGGISQNLGMKEEQQYVKSVMRASRIMNVPVHLLGGGRRELVRYKPYSADNSTWSATNRFGRLDAWHKGRNAIFTKQPIQRGRPCYIQPDLKRGLILKSYDLTWEDLYRAKEWKPGGMIAFANARSWMRLARDLARADVRYIFATSPGNIDVLKSAWGAENERRSK